MRPVHSSNITTPSDQTSSEGRATNGVHVRTLACSSGAAYALLDLTSTERTWGIVKDVRGSNNGEQVKL